MRALIGLKVYEITIPDNNAFDEARRNGGFLGFFNINLHLPTIHPAIVGLLCRKCWSWERFWMPTMTVESTCGIVYV